jgi:predicted RecB family nuclease
MDIVESITNSWTVFEHLKGIKRWKDDDLAWIKMSQEGLQESLGQLIGRDKASKRVANARIALRKWRDEAKQKADEDVQT